MTTVAISKDTFTSTVDNNEIVLMDFWASWCGPCMRFGPVYEEASERHSDVVFAKIDTEKEQELSAGLEISSIPTVMVFKKGFLVYRESGSLSGKQLDDLISQVKDLDVSELSGNNS